MPVHPDVPEPLKTALESMERDVQSFKTDLSYQAPEMHRELWIGLQEGLADTMKTLYEEATTKGGET
jgi:hypothetical protein